MSNVESDTRDWLVDNWALDSRREANIEYKDPEQPTESGSCSSLPFTTGSSCFGAFGSFFNSFLAFLAGTFTDGSGATCSGLVEIRRLDLRGCSVSPKSFAFLLGISSKLA